MSANRVGIAGDFGAEKLPALPLPLPALPEALPFIPSQIPCSPLTSPQFVPPNPPHRFYLRETGRGDGMRGITQ